MQVRGRGIILILLMITTGLVAFGCGSGTQAQIYRVTSTPPTADELAPTDDSILLYTSPLAAATPTPTEVTALTYNSPPMAATPTPANTPTPTDTPRPELSPIELTIVHTNDTRGYTEPCG